VLKRRRLPVLLAALAVTGLAASGCGSTTAAVRVNDSSISRSDFEDQLDAVYENAALRTVLFGQEVPTDQLRGPDGPPGSYNQQFVGGMVGAQVQFMVVAELLDERGLEVTEDDHDAFVAQLEGQAQGAGLDISGAFDELPGSMREQYLDFLVATELLQADLGDEVNTVVNDAYAAADVEVSSRYGTWDPAQGAVTPPAGPNSAPGADLGGLSPE
jgi:hypothetical protein